MAVDSSNMHSSMVSQWSTEDDAFLVALPEWNGRVLNTFVTHGDSYEEAAKNGNEVLEMLIEDALERGEELPALQVFVAANEKRTWQERELVR